ADAREARQDRGIALVVIFDEERARLVAQQQVAVDERRHQDQRLAVFAQTHEQLAAHFERRRAVRRGLHDPVEFASDATDGPPGQGDLDSRDLLRAAAPNMPPRPIDSTADDGTSINAPFSLRPSYKMFIARRCSAVGFSAYAFDAWSNSAAISTSASPRMMRARFSRAAWASRDMASCNVVGMTMSRISTACTVMPHGMAR